MSSDGEERFVSLLTDRRSLVLRCTIKTLAPPFCLYRAIERPEELKYFDITWSLSSTIPSETGQELVGRMSALSAHGLF